MAFYSKNFFKRKWFSNQVRVLSVGVGLLGGYAFYRTQNRSEEDLRQTTISSLKLKNVQVHSRQNSFANSFQLENCSAGPNESPDDASIDFQVDSKLERLSSFQSNVPNKKSNLMN